MYGCIHSAHVITSSPSRASASGNGAGWRRIAPRSVGKTDERTHSVWLKTVEAEKENGFSDLKVVADSSAIFRYPWIWALYTCTELSLTKAPSVYTEKMGLYIER